MAFNGQFLVQLDDLKNPPKGINVVALPFRMCWISGTTACRSRRTDCCNHETANSGDIQLLANIGGSAQQGFLAVSA